MRDGKIDMDSDQGREIGFTSDKFCPGSYLWKMNGLIVISFIASRSKGNFRKLVESINAIGLKVQVPTPLFEMGRIVQKNGYIHSREFDDQMGGVVDLWTQP